MNRAVGGSASIAVYGAMSLPCHCRSRRRSVSRTGPLACAGVTPDRSGAIIGSSSSHVVPANAGTHNHHYQLLEKISAVGATRSDTEYGSLLSQGRRVEAFGRDPAIPVITAATIQRSPS